MTECHATQFYKPKDADRETEGDGHKACWTERLNKVAKYQPEKPK